MKKPTLLVIEDDSEWVEILQTILGGRYDVKVAETGNAGLEFLANAAPSCVILDLTLRDYPAHEDLPILRRLMQDYPMIPVLILTAHVDTSLAVKATRLGAFDYITKAHFDKEKFIITLRNAVERCKLQNRIREQIEEDLANYPMIGDSPQIQQIRERIRRMAKRDDPVLVIGESGTGKEIVARHLHYNSNRSGGRFIVATFAGKDGPLAYSELFGHLKGAFTGATEARDGKFDVADGGTLFLDDVDILPGDVQAMLLRVLEDKMVFPLGDNNGHCVDVRIIASSNQDLKGLSKSSTFREDLFYRLSCLEINLPPLRERLGDILLLANHFLAQQNAKASDMRWSFSNDAVAMLLEHKWQDNNARELRNAIIRLTVESDNGVIDAEDVVSVLSLNELDLNKSESLKSATSDFRSQYIQRKLVEHGNSITKTALILGITRQQLQRLMKSFGINH